MKNIEQLQTYLTEKDFSQLFILTDDNTSKFCLPVLLEKVDILTDRQTVLLEIPAGEENKTLNTAENIIGSLSESEADRNACIVSLGGGVICDLGGFVSSVYKRGIQNVNVPTTLLAMADAAIGGKTAVNHSGIKNLIGTFNFTSQVFFDAEFLSTLSSSQIMDGIAEMLKTFVMFDYSAAEELMRIKDFTEIKRDLIVRCAEIKEKITLQDPYDRGIRKKLNFGHTLGHAVEMFYGLSHGHSVAVGMHYALDLSVEHAGYDKQRADKVKSFIENNYEIPDYRSDMQQLIPLMRQDKKNTDGEIKFILADGQ